MRICSQHRGFTLIEMMVVLAIMAIMATISAPSFSDYLANQRVRASTVDLLGTLTYARSEALKRNGTVFVRANGGDWSQGWVVTTSATKTYAQCLTNLSDCLHVQQPVDGIAVSGPANDLRYLRSGRIDGGAATYSLCNADSSSAVSRRQLRVDLSGRPNIALAGTCDA